MRRRLADVRGPGAAASAAVDRGPVRAGPAHRGRASVVGAERDREPQVRAGLVASAQALQALAEREVRVVGGRVDLEERLERRARPLGLARSCSTPGRAPRGSSPCRARGGRRARGRSPPGRDGGPRAARARAGAARRRSRGLGRIGLRGPISCHGRWSHGHGVRCRRARLALAVGRQVDRLSRGESVSPGMRPRLAIGRPSISLMSPVKSIGVAPLMYDPTAYESTGAPASLK